MIRGWRSECNENWARRGKRSLGDFHDPKIEAGHRGAGIVEC